MITLSPRAGNQELEKVREESLDEAFSYSHHFLAILTTLLSIRYYEKFIRERDRWLFAARQLLAEVF